MGRWQTWPSSCCSPTDCLTDGTQAVIKAIAERDDRVRYLSFSRNFGKEAAMYAGFEHCWGLYLASWTPHPSIRRRCCRKCCPPSWMRATTAPPAGSAARGEPKAVRSFFARQFYKIMNHISKTEIMDGARDL